MNLGTKSRISGAIFDFMGYLTTRRDVVTASAYHEPHDLLDAYCAWADERGLDSNGEAEVGTWNLGEQLICIRLGEAGDLISWKKSAGGYAALGGDAKLVKKDKTWYLTIKGFDDIKLGRKASFGTADRALRKLLKKEELEEFYSTGRLPMRGNPGTVGTAGSTKDTGRVDITNYKKRRKWMDSR